VGRFLLSKNVRFSMSDPSTASAQQTDAGATGGTQGGQTAEAPKLTQEQFNAALAAEKRKWQQAQAAEVAEAGRKAAEQEAAAKGEWERLANERGAKVTELEQSTVGATERLAAYEDVLTAQIKARVKTLPEAARSKLPEGNPLSQLAWLDAVEAAVAAATPTPPRQTPPGGGRTSASSAAPSMDAIIADKRARIGGL
jgi:hypothetical protein